MSEPIGVKNEEVMSCASKKCKLCYGAGWRHDWVQTGPDTKQRIQVICGCAKRRFMKKHGEGVTIQADGSMTWKEAA